MRGSGTFLPAANWIASRSLSSGGASRRPGGSQGRCRLIECDKLGSGQITSDFPKSCQARESKIFCFRSHANQSHNSARLTRLRGARDRHERAVRCGGREGATDVRAGAYGEVVWFGRRGAGVKLAIRSAGDGGKRAVLRGEHEVSRKAIAQGRPECSSCPVCSCAVLFAQIARGTAGAASTRSSLRPLLSERANQKMQASGAHRRENAKPYPHARDLSQHRCGRIRSPFGEMDCFASRLRAQ